MAPLSNQQFTAYVGIDWADTKHDICLQAAGNAKREFDCIPHQTARIDEWAKSLHQRFGGPIAVALELASTTVLTNLLGFPAAARAPLKSGKQRCSKLQSQRGDGIRHMALPTQGRRGAGSLRVRKTLRRVTDELEFFFEPPGVQ